MSKLSIEHLRRRKIKKVVTLATIGLLFVAIGCQGTLSPRLTFISPTPTESPSSTPSPSITPTATPNLEATKSAAIATALALPTTTPRIQETIVRFDDGVSVPQRTYIKEFIDLARREFGDAGVIYAYGLDQYASGACNNRPACAQSVVLNGRYSYGEILFYTKTMEKYLGDPGYYATMPHEYYHLRQGFLGGSHPSRISPDWMVEGTAEYMAWRFMERIQKYSFTDTRKSKTVQAIRAGVRLEDLEKSGALQVHTYSIGFLAVDMLASRAGEESVDKFYKTIGSGLTAFWQQAFERAFGISVEQFYVDFNKWREKNYEPPLQ